MSKVPKISFPKVNLNLKRASKLASEINPKAPKGIQFPGPGYILAEDKPAMLATTVIQKTGETVNSNSSMAYILMEDTPELHLPVKKGFGPQHDQGMDNIVNGRTHGGRGFITNR